MANDWNRGLGRRDFLAASGALAAGVWMGTSPDESRAESSPNEKLNLAVVGLGGQGGANLGAAGQHNVVALCDVDDLRAGKAYEKFPMAKKFADFRVMLDEMESKIDGVVVSTPDHTHFHPAWHAMSRGKHVYLEKPMAHSVWEVRELTRLAAQKKVATQLGVQRHTMGGVRRSVELIEKGAIGKVRACHSWVGGNRGMPNPPKEAAETPPATLDWDLWLGPTAERPYRAGLAPYDWRFWWEFGTGETGNWGCHILDIPFWALKLDYPTRVDASGPPVDADRTPKSMATVFDFPAAGDRPPVKLHWYHGTPPILAELKLDAKGMNTLFIGDDGMLLCGFNETKLLPEEKFKDYAKPEPYLPKSPGFHKEWFNACKGGPAASCDFSYSGPMTETVLLGNVAYRAGGFDWNASALQAGGNPKVEALLRTPFRKGWEV